VSPLSDDGTPPPNQHGAQRMFLEACQTLAHQSPAMTGWEGSRPWTALASLSSLRKHCLVLSFRNNSLGSEPCMDRVYSAAMGVDETASVYPCAQLLSPNSPLSPQNSVSSAASTAPIASPAPEASSPRAWVPRPATPGTVQVRKNA
jgi:hypothetical protein